MYLHIVPDVQRGIRKAKESSAHETLGLSASAAVHGSDYPGLSANTSVLSTGLYDWWRLRSTSKCRSRSVPLFCWIKILQEFSIRRVTVT